MIVRKTRYLKNTRFSRNKTYSRRNGTHRTSGINTGSNNSHRERVRGNPSQVLSKYLVLAKNALSSGDTIQAEYYFQHADHYSRIMSENGFHIKNNKEEKDENQLAENSIEEKITNNSPQENVNIEENDDEENNDKDNSLESVGFLSDPKTK